MIHIDFKKLDRIPDGGGWRADPNQSTRNHSTGHERVSFDYVHVAADDHSRLAYADVLPDEKGPTCAGFLRQGRSSHGSQWRTRETRHDRQRIRLSASPGFQNALDALGAKHILVKPRHPWQHGKAERFNRTLQEGWTYRQAFTSNQVRTDALQPWLNFYNNHRPHGSLGGKPETVRFSVDPRMAFS